MKKYQIKQYDKDGTLKQTINPKIIKNKINFTSQINGGLGQFFLSLDLPITNNDFIQGDIINIYSLQDSGSLILIYSGYIDDIIRTAKSVDQIDLRINGIFSFFKRLNYQESGNYIVNKSDDPGNIIQDAVDVYNAEYVNLTTDIDSVGFTIDYDIENASISKVINDMKDGSENYYWFLGADGKLIFKQISSTAENIFTFDKDLFKIVEEQDGIEIVNRLILEYKTGTQVYNDLTSQNLYGVREKFIENISIVNLSSANKYAESYFNEFANPSKKITVEINNEFNFINFFLVNDLLLTVDEYTQTINDLSESKNIETIQPGETCKINNINKDFGQNLIISKKTYTQEKITLNLEKYDNFIGLIRG